MSVLLGHSHQVLSFCPFAQHARVPVIETTKGVTPPAAASDFAPDADVVLHDGDCLEFLAGLPNGFARLIITSPPYNIGKQYERRIRLDDYLAEQARVIKECVRVLADNGSLCWQVGNFVDDNEIVPLDIALWSTFHELGLKMRNRIVWHFEHGLHCSRRFSGRYETIAWFTKSDRYVFNLDAVRAEVSRQEAFQGAEGWAVFMQPAR